MSEIFNDVGREVKKLPQTELALRQRMRELAQIIQNAEDAKQEMLSIRASCNHSFFTKTGHCAACGTHQGKL